MSKTAEQYEAEYQATTEKVKRCRNPKCGSMDTLPSNMYKTQGGQRIEIPGARRCGMCGTWYNLYQESYITAEKELDALIKQNKEIGKQVKKVIDALSALIGKENEDAPNA